MSGFYQGTTKTHQIPIDHLDYKYIEECKDVKHLEKILRVLRLGEEGNYPDLTTFCEKRIEALSPNNRTLRKDKPPATAADFSFEDWREIGDDLKNFLTDIKLKEQQEPISQQNTDNLPPIRSSSKGPLTNKKEHRSAGSKVPRDYTDWDRFDIEKELSEIDKTKEQSDQSKTVINTTASKIKKTVATKGTSPEEKGFLAEREKDKGNEAFRSGDYEEAILYYSRSISVLPTAIAYNNKAQAEIKLKNWQDALADCGRALDLEPNNVKALLRRSVVHKNLRNFQAASTDLKTVLLHEPENPIAKRVLCEVDELLQKEKEETSKKGRRILIQDIEGSDEKHQDASVVEKEAGVTVGGGGETAAELIEMGNAQKKFSPKKGNEKEEVRQTPRHSKESNGVKDSSNGKPQNHVDRQEKPEQPGGKAQQRSRTGSQEAKLSSQPLPLAAQLKNEGNQLFKNGQFGEASVKYSEAIENLKNTGSEDTEELGVLYSNRAACHLKDGNCAECIEDCNKALELQPFSLKPLLRRAMANESLEKYRQAYVDYKVALQIDSGMQLANDSINRITRTLIDLDGPNWREKLPPIPSVPVSTQIQHQKNMAATNNARPEKETGKSVEEQFLSLKQEGNDYVKKCQYREAEKKYTECLKLKPEECTMYTNRALCFLKLCQYEEARQDCDCALQRDAANIKALYRRAQAYKGLEKYQDCASDLRKLISLDSSVTEAKTLLTEITPFLLPNGEEKQRKKILIEEVEDENTSDPSNVTAHEDNESLRKTHSRHITKPSNALEFDQLMSEMRAGKDQEGCAQLLSFIDPKDLPMFLSNKLDTETLLLIVQSLKHHVLEKNPALVYWHLTHLGSADRFSVVVLLLNNNEKDQIQSVFTSLLGIENENFDQEAITNLTKTYGL
ncbi:sperm-associated antigen 1 isoform X2 [Dendropsophus ebraccatus]|uniref:sperm-associated antigen 1 isoform X2 n=1 Tax=Dendropsophus ebraccatus TaxID=150705 RepID=UPI0038318848